MFADKFYYLFILIKGKSERDVGNVRSVKRMTVVNVDTALICLNLEAQESERSVALNGIVQHLLLMYKLVLHIHECSYIPEHNNRIQLKVYYGIFIHLGQTTTPKQASWKNWHDFLLSSYWKIFRSSQARWQLSV